MFIVFKAINQHDILDERLSRCIKMPAHGVTVVRHSFTTTLKKKKAKNSYGCSSPKEFIILP